MEEFNRILIAVLLLAAPVFSGCAQPINKSTTGALTGSALGAGLGAIIGSQSGHAGPGIAIGAAAGALGGALIGNSMDNQDRQRAALEGQIGRNQAQIDENQRLIDELRRRGVDARSTDRGVVVNLPDVLFEFDRARLTREAESTVGDIAQVIRDTRGRRISVEGHTDSVGSEEYNGRLSRRRAESVAEELNRAGVPSSQMEVSGFGKQRPVADNSTAVGRARNRRVEVIIEN